MFGGKQERNDHLAELSGQVEQTHQDVTALKARIEHLEMVIRCMWNVLKEHHAECDDEKLREAVRSLERLKTEAARVAEPCPVCRRPLQGNSKMCVYCGNVVERKNVFGPL